jgi:hypothetical protein
MAFAVLDGKPYARLNVLIVEADQLPQNGERRTPFSDLSSLK